MRTAGADRSSRTRRRDRQQQQPLNTVTTNGTLSCTRACVPSSVAQATASNVWKSVLCGAAGDSFVVCSRRRATLRRRTRLYETRYGRDGRHRDCANPRIAQLSLCVSLSLSPCLYTWSRVPVLTESLFFSFPFLYSNPSNLR